MDTQKKRVFSGVQPTGLVHIGNYLGAIRNWVGLLDQYDCIFCIVDYHAITVPYDPKAMQKRILETAIAYIACGIDPDKCAIFVQSQVPEHTELTWILNTLAPVGLLERQTQYKDKTARKVQSIIIPNGETKIAAAIKIPETMEHYKDENGEKVQPIFIATERDENTAKMGLLDYPVLQAADILLYKAEIVPVGEDQAQHLELARDLARKFNSTFGRLFPEPGTLIGIAPKILGLDGQKKMSKSMNNYISLTEKPESIMKKMRRAVTDSGKEIVFSEEKPAVTNLLTVYSCFTGKGKEEVENHFEGKGYKELKEELAEVIVESLKPIRKKWNDLAADPGYVWSLLEKGARDCGQIARQTMREVKERMGLIHE